MVLYLAYYDEAGDDGFPRYSSPLFVLSACYLHYLNWNETHKTIHSFRQRLKLEYGIPVNQEFHCKYFLLNKNPFRALNLPGQDRAKIIALFCDMISQLNVRFINVAIIKSRIVSSSYNVLDMAFKYSIQRIENDLDPTQQPEKKFMIITDPGRIGKMRKTSRRIQRINYIPSKFTDTPYRREIKALIEDPLPQDSEQSHFIQLCDIVSYIIYLHCLVKTKSGHFSNRMPEEVTPKIVEGWLDKLLPCLNTKASGVPHGIVIHPTKVTIKSKKAAR
jgi:hypothetical protein